LINIRINKELIAFGVMGGLSTVFAMFSFPIIYSIIFRNNFFEICYVLSTLLNITFSHSLQRRFVFFSKKPYCKELYLFAKGAVLLAIIGYVLLRVTYYYINNIFYANILTTVLIAIASYVLHKFVTFKEKKE